MQTHYWLKPRRLVGIVLIVGLIITAAWSMSLYRKIDNSHTLKVATTYYPLFDMASQVGGDLAEVINITPPGEEPHEYAPTPQQLVELQNTKALFYNGATFEPWVTQFVQSYKGQAVAASGSIPLLPVSDSETLLATDPHFWLDPVYAQQMVTTILNAFIKVDPDNAATYRQNADHYISSLKDLDNDFINGLKNCNTRTVISSHDAMTYLSKRYTFNVAAIAGISPSDEPSPAKLAELTQLIRTNGITTVLFETLASPKLAQTLAAETGARTAVFDPIEGLTQLQQAEGNDYISVQEQNLEVLREAMQCR